MAIISADIRYLTQHRKCVGITFPAAVDSLTPGVDLYQFGCSLEFHCATHCKSYAKCAIIWSFYGFSGRHHAGDANTYVMEEG
jgi:hypothetical protein